MKRNETDLIKSENKNNPTRKYYLTTIPGSDTIFINDPDGNEIGIFSKENERVVKELIKRLNE